MKCQLCGAPAHPGHVYCARCAHEAAQRQAWQYYQHQAPRPVVKRNPWKPLLVSLLLLGALAGGAMQAQKLLTPLLGHLGAPVQSQSLAAQTKQIGAALRAEASAADSTMSVEEAPPQATLAAEAPSPQPTMAVSAPAAAPVLGASQGSMPTDVRNWLNHLRKIETERQSLSKSQVSKATALLGQLQGGGMLQGGEDEDHSNSKVAAASGASNEVQQTWGDLEQRFISVSAPSECLPLQIAYDRTLKETGAMVGGILHAIESSSSNQQGALSTLTQMQGQSASRVDTPAMDADTLLAGIYARYGVGKEFSIASDVAM